MFFSVHNTTCILHVVNAILLNHWIDRLTLLPNLQKHHKIKLKSNLTLCSPRDGDLIKQELKYLKVLEEQKCSSIFSPMC